MAKFDAGIIVCLILVSSLAVPSMAMTYNVGDRAGWASGVDYGTWASGKALKVGDTLVFSYGSGHTVSEVSPSDYDACNAANAINTDSSGATTITLETAGTHYFICGVMGHCDGGMKVAVTVTAGGDVAATPSESTTAPPPSTTVGSQSPLTPTVASDPPSSTIISQSPLIPTTTAFAPSASETVSLSSSAGTLSTFGAALITCAAMIFELVLS